MFFKKFQIFRTCFCKVFNVHDICEIGIDVQEEMAKRFKGADMNILSGQKYLLKNAKNKKMKIYCYSNGLYMFVFYNCQHILIKVTQEFINCFPVASPPVYSGVPLGSPMIMVCRGSYVPDVCTNYSTSSVPIIVCTAVREAAQ